MSQLQPQLQLQGVLNVGDSNKQQQRTLIQQYPGQIAHSHPHYTINTQSLISDTTSSSATTNYYSDNLTANYYSDNLPVPPSSNLNLSEDKNVRYINPNQKRILDDLKQHWSQVIQHDDKLMMASPNQSHRNPTDPLPAIPIRETLLDQHSHPKTSTPNTITLQQSVINNDYVNNPITHTPIQRSKTFSSHSKTSQLTDYTRPVTPPPTNINTTTANPYTNSPYTNRDAGLENWSNVKIQNLNTARPAVHYSIADYSNLSDDYTNMPTKLYAGTIISPQYKSRLQHQVIAKRHNFSSEDIPDLSNVDTANELSSLKDTIQIALVEEPYSSSLSKKRTRSADQLLNAVGTSISNGDVKSREESLGILRGSKKSQMNNSSAFSSPTNRGTAPSPTSSEEELQRITCPIGGIVVAKRSSSFNVGDNYLKSKQQLTPRHEKVKIISNIPLQGADTTRITLTDKNNGNGILSSVNEEPVYARVNRSAHQKSTVYGEKLIRSKSEDRLTEAKSQIDYTTDSKETMIYKTRDQCPVVSEDMANLSDMLIQQLKSQTYPKPIAGKQLTQNINSNQLNNIKSQLSANTTISNQYLNNNNNNTVRENINIQNATVQTPKDWAEFSNQNICENCLFLVETGRRITKQLTSEKEVVNKTQEEVRRLEYINNQLIHRHEFRIIALKENYEYKLDQLQREFIRNCNSLLKDNKPNTESYEKYKTARNLFKNISLNLKEKSNTRGKHYRDKESAVSKTEDSISTDLRPMEESTDMLHPVKHTRKTGNENETCDMNNRANENTITDKAYDTNMDIGNRNLYYDHDDKLSAIEEMSIRTSHKDSIQQTVSILEDNHSDYQQDQLHEDASFLSSPHQLHIDPMLQVDRSKSLLKPKKSAAQTTLSRLKEGNNSLYRPPSPDPFNISENYESNIKTSPNIFNKVVLGSPVTSNGSLKEEINYTEEFSSEQDSKLSGNVKSVFRKLFTSHIKSPQKRYGNQSRQLHSQKIKSPTRLQLSDTTNTDIIHVNTTPIHKQAPNPSPPYHNKNVDDTKLRKQSFMIATSGNPLLEQTRQWGNNMYFSNPSINSTDNYSNATRMQQSNPANLMRSSFNQPYIHTPHPQLAKESNFSQTTPATPATPATAAINTATTTTTAYSNNNDNTRMRNTQESRVPYTQSSKRISIPPRSNINSNDHGYSDFSRSMNKQSSTVSSIANSSLQMRHSIDGSLLADNLNQYNMLPMPQPNHPVPHYYQDGSYTCNSDITRDRRYAPGVNFGSSLHRTSSNYHFPRDIRGIATVSYNNNSPYYRGRGNTSAKSNYYPSISDL